MSTTEQGLSTSEAARRLATHGPNDPAPVRRLPAVVQLFHPFANPLVVILLLASAIAACLGQQVDALIIATIVVLGVSINFWQSDRSQQAGERLRSSVSPTATVLRDGSWQETPVRNVVTGDVFQLAGDLVPADARLLESRDLSVQQSMLTGESLPADKAVVSAGHDDAGALTRRTLCSSAHQSSAAPGLRSRPPRGRRPCLATLPCVCGAGSPKPNSSMVSADSVC
jgi:Mg2+-importing ATPase